MTRRLLLDTSVLVDRERGAPGIPIHDQWAISAMTLSELNVGLLLARDTGSRQRRIAGFTDLVGAEVLPFDDGVARTHAELSAWAISNGIRPPLADGIIAATAATHGLVLVTLDHGFERLAGFEGLELQLV